MVPRFRVRSVLMHKMIYRSDSPHFSTPTALDALIFAYLHCILHSKENLLRFEVTRRVNLVAWERRVQSDVRSAFERYMKY